MAGWFRRRFICRELNGAFSKSVELKICVYLNRSGVCKREGGLRSHPYGATVFKEIGHVGERDLLGQPSDVDGAVLGLILLSGVC